MRQKFRGAEARLPIMDHTMCTNDASSMHIDNDDVM